MVSVGVVGLRRRAPHLHRPFRTPCLPLVAALGILVSLAQACVWLCVCVCVFTAV